jgi:hypothetical protein
MGRNVGKSGPRANPQELFAESIKESKDSTKLRTESAAMETEEYDRTRKRSTAGRQTASSVGEQALPSRHNEVRPMHELFKDYTNAE